MFDRVLVANRGEIVVRIARTLRRLGSSPATVYTGDDPGRAHVRACDAAVEIESYLDPGAIVQAALRVRAQAIHPGYGFLSERPELARACQAAGLVWVGPPVAAIEMMGDKSAARKAAQLAGVPIVTGIDDPSVEEAQAFAREQGLPLLIKAAGGGGGKGMRVISELSELQSGLAAARREALAAFGDGTLLVEQFIAPARHIELQLLADTHGTVIELGERECSLQRRHQKVIEETPSPVVDEALRSKLVGEGIALARACGYVGAGTIEFVAHAADPARHYFLEMNTRLQVEHTVTEEVHGIDLVEWQLRVAAGERLPEGLGAERSGHAIQARVYAEDAAHGFLPATGVVRALRLPCGPGTRVDAGIETGEQVGTRFDPLLFKLVAHGATRAHALARLRNALHETSVLGVTSNVGFLCDLLDDQRVIAGDIDTGLIESLTPASTAAGAPRAALVAAIAATLDDRGSDPFVTLGDWRLSGEAPTVTHGFVVDGETEVQIGLGTAAEHVLVDSEQLTGGRLLRIAFDGVSETWVVAGDAGRWWVSNAGHSWQVVPLARERGAEAGGEGDVRAPMPGAVVAVHTHEGAQVSRGDVLVVMESMKMELQITAPWDGCVAALHVVVGDQVTLDAVLASMAPQVREAVA